MFNYHGGKLVQRGPNPLSSHITFAFKKFTKNSIYGLFCFCNTLFLNFFLFGSLLFLIIVKFTNLKGTCKFHLNNCFNLNRNIKRFYLLNKGPCNITICYIKRYIQIGYFLYISIYCLNVKYFVQIERMTLIGHPFSLFYFKQLLSFSF